MYRRFFWFSSVPVMFMVQRPAKSVAFAPATITAVWAAVSVNVTVPEAASAVAAITTSDWPARINRASNVQPVKFTATLFTLNANNNA